MLFIKKVENVYLLKGVGAADGLFRLTNTETKDISFWFGKETAEDLLKMSDDDFLHEARVRFEYADMA